MRAVFLRILIAASILMNGAFALAIPPVCQQLESLTEESSVLPATKYALHYFLVNNDNFTVYDALSISLSLARDPFTKSIIENAKSSSKFKKLVKKWDNSPIKDADDLIARLTFLINRLAWRSGQFKALRGLQTFIHGPQHFTNQISQKAVQIVKFQNALLEHLDSMEVPYSIESGAIDAMVKDSLWHTLQTLLPRPPRNAFDDLRTTDLLKTVLKERGEKGLEKYLKLYFGPEAYVLWMFRHSLHFLYAKLGVSVVAVAYILYMGHANEMQAYLNHLSPKERQAVIWINRKIQKSPSSLQKELEEQLKAENTKVSPEEAVFYDKLGRSIAND